jgi:hypothetical protein
MPEPFTQADAGSPVVGCPNKPAPTHWLEIELVGEDGSAIPSVEYVAELPNGDKARGFLDDQGYGRIDGIESAGSCKVGFPDLDGEAWLFLETTGERGAAGGGGTS